MAESSSFSVAKELMHLGDPSGRQDGAYWDDWFDVVCRRREHRSFEWYCSTDEVLRVVSHHLLSCTDDRRQYAMIHPGSGTSLVPVRLRDFLPESRHVVVDISTVAIDEMRDFHEQHSPSCASKPIEYVLADLLTNSDDVDEQATFLSSTFDCWIDKGLVDAIFSKEAMGENLFLSASLFEKARRTLKPATGFAIVVSLAEEHSVQIVIENWLSHDGWQPTIHVWEIAPSSGELPPFAFVLFKADNAVRGSNERLQLVWHRLDSGDVEEYALRRETALSDIQDYLANSRRQFSESKAKESSNSAVRKVLTTIEVKSYDAEEDLAALGLRIQNQTWSIGDCGEQRSLSPLWQPFTEEGSSEMHKIVPIGFGISKLLVKCVIASDELDVLIELLEEWDIDLIQSVDVDWQHTIPVGDITRPCAQCTEVKS